MQDSILHLPAWLTDTNTPITTSNDSTLNIIFFIPGNPGLISYYTTFLHLLHCHNPNTVIAGASLGGFETHSHYHEVALETGIFYAEGYERKVYDLREQVVLTHERVGRLVGCVRGLQRERQGDDEAGKVNMVLVGHSVGAWIAMEVVRREHEEHRRGAQDVSVSSKDDRDMSFEIVATMLLTPTIHEIGSSPSGKIATPVLTNLPLFPALVQGGAGMLASVLPAPWLGGLVGKVTGMKSQSAIDATTTFLRTPGAVKQALHMAGQEMAEIRNDRWGDEVWGVATQTNIEAEQGVWRAPKHYFLFAKTDHWVADTTREAIVKARGSNARIVVDEDGTMGLVHAWCLEQSEVVAGVVNGWLGNVLDSSAREIPKP